MPQQIVINLDAEQDPASALKHTAGRDVLLFQAEDQTFYLSYLNKVLEPSAVAGFPPVPGPLPRRSIVLLSALGRDKDGSDIAVVFEITAVNFMRLAGAVAGRMAFNGEINVGVDPPMAVAMDPDKDLLHFVLEGPPRNTFDYSVEQAGKIWRIIREFCERIKQRPKKR